MKAGYRSLKMQKPAWRLKNMCFQQITNSKKTNELNK